MHPKLKLAQIPSACVYNLITVTCFPFTQSAYKALNPDEDTGEGKSWPSPSLSSARMAAVCVRARPWDGSSSSALSHLLRLKLSLPASPASTRIKQERGRKREKNVFREWNVTVDKHHKLLHIYYVQQFD